VKACTQLPVHPRHPYAGELVFTAFSGSHQDAIRKCLARRDAGDVWDVAYLPIDPADLGRSYQEVIRINSQSGKGGVAWVLEQTQGLELPRWLQIDFSTVVQRHAEETETEVAPATIAALFDAQYLGQTRPYTLVGYEVTRAHGEDQLKATLHEDGRNIVIQGRASGVVGAFIAALEAHTGKKITLVEYSEHAVNPSAGADAVTYVQLNLGGRRWCGVGRSSDIVEASLRAILSALNQPLSAAPGLAA
jgi:2-isopropylmalate synthase